jgi:GNAT superfamily N-acetyltransferase
MKFEIVSITDDLNTGVVWLSRSELLHRTLRPAIPDAYEDYLRKMFAEGAEMAVLHVDGVPKSLAVYRCLHTTFHGYRFYIDDLVTDESQRGQGFGAALLCWCEHRAIARGCDTFDLESGVQRPRTHQFYFREGLTIFAFSFTKQLPKTGS